MEPMRFIGRLHQFWVKFISLLPGVPAKEPALVANGEPLSRFLVSSKCLNRTDPKKPRLTPFAFIPQREIKFSVFRIRDWSLTELRAKGVEIADRREQRAKELALADGRDYPDSKRSIHLYGAGIVSGQDVRDSGLDVKPDEPPQKHAIIVGWPPLVGNNRQDEAVQMLYALKLLSRARFLPLNS